MDRKIHDIYHGLDYANFLLPGGFRTETCSISFTVNTDGVNKFSSSRASHLWPVYITINELPKEYRLKKKYIVPAYMYCDKHDPNMLTFLSPLMDKVNVLHEKGIDIKDSAEGHINVRCLLFVVTADLPARAELMNIKRFNAKCACHLCKGEGKWYGLNNLHRYRPFRQNEPRNHDEQLSYAATASQKKAVMGVKGHSVFSKLKYPFDLVFSFAIDWMHCVSLGCVKYVMTLLLQDKGKSYFIGAASTTKTLTERLLAIKPPDIVGRYPRALTELTHRKATELKNWLLHYSLAVMYSTLQPLYLLHWSLLVGAVGILTSDSIFSKYGQRFSSIMYERARKTDCSVIEYIDKDGHISFGKIQCFL